MGHLILNFLLFLSHVVLIVYLTEENKGQMLAFERCMLYFKNYFQKYR